MNSVSASRLRSGRSTSHSISAAMAIMRATDIKQAVAAAEGREMTLTVWRDGETFDSTMTARRRDIPADDGLKADLHGIGFWCGWRLFDGLKADLHGIGL